MVDVDQIMYDMIRKSGSVETESVNEIEEIVDTGLDKTDDNVQKMAMDYLTEKLEGVHLYLYYATTQLAMENEPRLTDTEPTWFYDRGDLTLDGKADVSDAVLLARYLASDAEAAVNDQGLANADIDGNGSVRDADLTALLMRIAKKI